EHMRGRYRLMNSGVIFITIEIGKNGHLKKEPRLSMIGVCPDQDWDEIEDLVNDTIVHTIHNMPDKKLNNDDTFAEEIRNAVRRRMNAHRSKKPVVVVHLVK